MAGNEAVQPKTTCSIASQYDYFRKHQPEYWGRTEFSAKFAAPLRSGLCHLGLPGLSNPVSDEFKKSK